MTLTEIDLRARETGPNKGLARLNRAIEAAGMAHVTRCSRVRLNRGGYAPWGRYFGVGAPLYEIWEGDRLPYYARAGDRWGAMYAHFTGRSHA